jgi:transposase
VKDWNGVTLDSGETATQFADLQSVLVKYIKRGVFVMEACTNYYHLYKEMKEKKIDVHVANVLQLRKLIGKNDKLDSERLADMLRLNAMPESYIPEERIQNLRILIGLYHSEVIARVRYNNQIDAVLDRNGINLPVKNPFSKKGLVCINQYLQENNNFAIRTLLEGMKTLNERIEHLSSEILVYIKNNFLQEYELLKSIPGVGDVLAGYLIAEICPIDRFANKRKLRRYAGVVPVREQSDKKIYATYLPKHASRKLLRYALVLAANCAVRTDCRPRKYYQKKKKGRNHGHAIMCVASSLSDIVYMVLKTKQPYNL